MNAILELLSDTIQKGLNEATITTRAQWANAYRIMPKPFPGPWTFKYHPWLYEMHNCEYNTIVGQKAAQMGYSEWVINFSFHALDVKNENVLYVLPTTKDAGDFSVARFDIALDLSPHIKEIFNNVNNVGLKRAKNNILFVRGSHSRSQLKSIPAPLLIFDELDEMPRGMIELAEYRAQGQIDYRIIMLSTPTIKDEGINKQFNLSTQDYYFFKCPHCSRFITFEYPESLVITAEEVTDLKVNDSYYICTQCKARLDHETKIDYLLPIDFGGNARFISSHTDREIKGYHINNLYASVKAGRPAEVAKKAIAAKLDETTAQEFYNSKLGLCYEAKGARVSQEQINECIGSYSKGEINYSNIRTMGIDVGKVLHIVIKEFYSFKRQPGLDINLICRAKLIYEGESSGLPDDFKEAEQLFREYKCKCCVVDIEPEQRAALTFAQTLWGRVYLCDYLSSQSGRRILVNEDELTVKCNRTSWLDLSQGRYKNKTIDLPINTSNTFKRQIMSPLRILREDKWGNSYAVYVNSKADHFAHADNYAEIALPIATKAYETTDIIK